MQEVRTPDEFIELLEPVPTDIVIPEATAEAVRQMRHGAAVMTAAHFNYEAAKADMDVIEITRLNLESGTRAVHEAVLAGTLTQAEADTLLKLHHHIGHASWHREQCFKTDPQTLADGGFKSLLAIAYDIAGQPRDATRAPRALRDFHGHIKEFFRFTSTDRPGVTTLTRTLIENYRDQEHSMHKTRRTLLQAKDPIVLSNLKTEEMQEMIDQVPHPSLVRTLAAYEILRFVRDLPVEMVELNPLVKILNYPSHRDAVASTLLNTFEHENDLFKDLVKELVEIAPQVEVRDELGILEARKREQLLSELIELLRFSFATFNSFGSVYSNKLVENKNRWHGVGQEAAASVEAAQRTMLDSLDLRPETMDREKLLVALALESWGVRLARSVTELFGSRLQAKTPLHDTVRYLERMEQEQQSSGRIEELSSLIEIFDQTYTVSAKQLRAMGGLGLRKRLEDWVEPGSQKALFLQEKAQAIAGLALQYAADPKKLQFLRRDLYDARIAWIELSTIKKGAIERNGLLSAVDTLLELYESATDPQLNDKSLQPLWNFASFIKAEVTADVQPAAEEPAVVAHAFDHAVASADTDEDVVSRLNREFYHREFIQAFPPGTTERDIITDLEKHAAEASEPHPIEWERISSLLELNRRLLDAGYAVALHRLRQSEWHPMPHYVLEITSNSDGTVAVVESPIYGNATYVVPSSDWRTIVEFSKKGAQEFGALPKVHAHGSTSEEHRQKLYHTVLGQL
jgi:hypothetical protein